MAVACRPSARRRRWVGRRRGATRAVLWGAGLSATLVAVMTAPPVRSQPVVALAVSASSAPALAEAVARAEAVSEPLTAQEAAESGAANAAANGIRQSVAIVDRTTGQMVGSYNEEQLFNSESIVKLFTAAYYLVKAEGKPTMQRASDLRTMIQVSDNGIQIALWRVDILPTISSRYGLTDTRNSPRASSGNWGSDKINAEDEVTFLYKASQDPLVGPLLMTWMAGTAPAGADGFNQSFGLNAMAGDHGSKQGWSDPGWSPANLHSVGWTGRYFAAILQTSPSASYKTMRATSTNTATLITQAAQPVAADPPAANPSSQDPAPPPEATGSSAPDQFAEIVEELIGWLRNLILW